MGFLFDCAAVKMEFPPSSGRISIFVEQSKLWMTWNFWCRLIWMYLYFWFQKAGLSWFLGRMICLRCPSLMAQFPKDFRLLFLNPSVMPRFFLRFSILDWLFFDWQRWIVYARCRPILLVCLRNIHAHHLSPQSHSKVRLSSTHHQFTQSNVSFNSSYEVLSCYLFDFVDQLH